MKTKNFSLFVAGLLTVSVANAAINIATVLVGDVGNPADPLNSGTVPGIGSVNYEYHIGTYEVTNAQYTSFLNSVAATDTYGLYNTSMASMGGITRSGSSGSYTYTATNPDTPVNYVSFWDAARFTNWLSTGNTETGVYNLGGVITPSNSAITRDATAFANGGVAIASENEWYKAAYYNGSGGYWLYPTQSNTPPTATGPNSTNANSANYDFVVGNVTAVGSYTLAASHYGTFDQSGNVFELNDEIISTRYRGLRGGSFTYVGSNLQSSGRGYVDPPDRFLNIGFRVTSLEPIVVPEPSTYAAILGGLGLLIVLLRQNGRRTL